MLSESTLHPPDSDNSDPTSSFSTVSAKFRRIKHLYRDTTTVPLTSSYLATLSIKYMLPQCYHLTLSHKEPKNFSTTSNHPLWRQVMQLEFEALQKNQTWTLIPRPPNTHIIWCKWVY
ncbi:unnamed protein product [Spirodela intermedia]|uniref:Uncharacterized protein n=1 Tax=Spirodela intermedia TaxID=51605 RepID=A0A7I8KG79_SPIIN|nr:unnamed protein product [Spirodela intermedia]